MKRIENLYEIIEKENIIYEESDLSKLQAKGIYVNLNEIRPFIAIDISIVNNPSTYLSILSEELGHHFTTSGNLISPSKSYMDKLIKNKSENLARKWAANFLITDEEFVQALTSSIHNIYDMCDYFNVTSEILEFKLNSILKDEIKYHKIKSILNEFQYDLCNI